MVPPAWDEEEEDDALLDGLSNGYDNNDIADYGDEDEDDSFEDEDEEEYDDEEVVDEEEDELEALIDEGEALIEEGEYAAALELFREACDRFPDNPWASYHVGQTALMMFTDGIENEPNWQDDDDLVGLHEEALNAFETAISLDEEYYPALNGLGALYILTRSPKLAVEAWEKSLAANPDQEDIEAALDQARSRVRR